MKAYRSEKAGQEIQRTYDLLLQKWGLPVEEREIETLGGTTHVVLCGDERKPPLVLFHGVGDDAALMWVYNAAFLAKERFVIAVDTLGGPGKSRMNLSYDKTFDDVVWIDGLLEGLGLDRVALAGVSHGGYLCQLYALERPNRVEKAICISAAVPTGEGGSPMKTMMKIFMPEALFPTKKNTVKLLQKLSGENAAVFTDDPLILEHYGWLLKGFNNMAMGYHKVRSFSDEEITRIRPLCYYLAGEDDPFQTLGGREALLRQKMNVRFYPKAGHGLNHEKAAEINQMMLDILAGRVERL